MTGRRTFAIVHRDRPRVERAFAGPAGASDASVCADAAEHAQQLRRTESTRAAREELVRTCAKPACPALVKKDCAAWLADLDKALPTLVFHVEGPNGEAVQATR